jgi:hypothetical protein
MRLFIVIILIILTHRVFNGGLTIKVNGKSHSIEIEDKGKK